MMSHIENRECQNLWQIHQKGKWSDPSAVSCTHLSVHWVVTQQLHEVCRLSPEVGVSQVSTHPAPAGPPKISPLKAQPIVRHELSQAGGLNSEPISSSAHSVWAQWSHGYSVCVSESVHVLNAVPQAHCLSLYSSWKWSRASSEFFFCRVPLEPQLINPQERDWAQLLQSPCAMSKTERSQECIAFGEDLYLTELVLTEISCCYRVLAPSANLKRARGAVG